MNAHVPDVRPHEQQRRRENILRAASALVSRNGIDAMRMRTVAARAGVALGTLYRYFPSKMDLIVAIVAEELDSFEAGIERRPLTATTPAARAVELLMRATRTLIRDPALAEGIVRSMAFTHGDVGAEFGDRISRLLTHAAFGDPQEEEPDPAHLVLSRLLQSLWLSELLGLLHGRRTMDEAQWYLEFGATRLLRDL